MGSSSSKPRQLFTYAIAVFESLWPRITSLPGDESPRLVGDDDAKVAFKYSGDQNQFTGYFKVIPLNLMRVDTNSTRNGHTFDVKLDPSLLYVEAHPDTLSETLMEYLESHTLSVPEQTTNFLVGLLDGYSRDSYSSMSSLNYKPKRFVLPGELFSQLVGEMDTCSLFVVNELGDFAEEELIKLYGGSFSRINELDITDSGRRLVDIGILPTMEPIDTSSFLSVVSVVRNFVSNANLYINTGLSGGTAFRFYSRRSSGNAEDELQLFRDWELKALSRFDSHSDASSNAGAEGGSSVDVSLNNVVGRDITLKYLVSLEQGVAGVADRLRNDIENYYDSHPARFAVSWSVYHTILLRLGAYISADFVTLTQSGGEAADPSVVVTPAADAIATSIALDLAASQTTPNDYSRLRVESNHYPIVESIVDNINEWYRVPEEHAYKPEQYIMGLVQFASLVNEWLEHSKAQRMDLDLYSPDEIVDAGGVDGDERSGVLEAQGLDDLTVPLSSHTPGLLLKGHITSIETSSSVNTSGYSKEITVTGEGLELPLKRHTIFYDQINQGRQLFFKAMQFAVSAANPIQAALEVINIFAPPYVRINKASNEDVESHNELARNVGLYYGDGMQNAVMVEHGTLIYPEALSTEDEAYMATPIHFVHTGYLRAIRDVFDEVNLAQYIALQKPMQLPQTNIYSVLSEILGNSSAYTWFIDEFGFVKVRYENAAAVAPSPTVLSPIITDDEIISIRTTTSEENLFTLTEVVPNSLGLNSPSEGRLLGIFGRSVPPNVEDYYALYSVRNLDLDNKEARADIATMLAEALTVFNDKTLEALKMQRQRVGSTAEVPPSVYNNFDFESVRRAIVDYHVEKTVEFTEVVEEEVGHRDVPITSIAELRSRIRPEYRPKLYDAFLERIIEVSADLGVPPEWLIAIMALETGGEFKANTPNRMYDYDKDPCDFTAIGLIQFIASTAAGQLGMPRSNCDELQAARAAMGSMTEVQQMTYVYNYLKDKGPYRERADMYVAVIYPVANEDKHRRLGYVFRRNDPRMNDPNNKNNWEAAWANNYRAFVDPDADFVRREDMDAKLSVWHNNVFLEPDIKPLYPGEEGRFTRTAYRKVPTAPEEGYEIESMYDPVSLGNIFSTVGNMSQSSLYDALRDRNFDNLVSRRVNDTLVFDLQSAVFKDFDYVSDDGTVGSNLYHWIALAVEDVVTNMKLTHLGDISGFTYKGRGEFLQLLSTLAVIGVTPDNIHELVEGETDQAKTLQFILRNTRLYVDPQELNQFPAEALVINAAKNRALPYQNYSLQDTRPQAISPDLFRYGVRVYRLDDNFLTTIDFTRFRAETLRTLHEEPVRDVNLEIIGNPMYKVGSTALVVSREIEERKYNYIHYGIKKTMEDLGFERSRLIFKVDDIIEQGNHPSVVLPFETSHTVTQQASSRRATKVTQGRIPGYLETRDGPVAVQGSSTTIVEQEASSVKASVVTPEGIWQHFNDAYEFILNESPYPVPISAYVPLYGVYSADDPLIIEYLRTLVFIATNGHIDSSSFRKHEERLQQVLIDITANMYGGDYTYKQLTDVVNLLTPQYYHAYQYYFDNVSNRWSFGDTYTTSLRGTFGTPAAICHIPVANGDFSKFHVVGYLLSKSPYALYSDRGNPHKVVQVDHPLYTFTLRQQEEDWEFYKSSSRYTVASAVARIRRKLLYPDLYGGI